MKRQMDDHGEIRYFVKWQGYTAKWNTLLHKSKGGGTGAKCTSCNIEKKQKKRERSEDESL